MKNICILLSMLLLSNLLLLDAFLSPVRCRPRTSARYDCSSTHLMAATKTTLTEETEWNLRLVLRGVPTQQGKRVDEIFSVRAQFLEEEGYEPPQGNLKPIDQETETGRLKITKSRWQLSEDPNDRRDGLWVWGLFKEPLYPYMLLQLETDEIPLAAGEDSIQPLQLYAQINHKRDDELGVLLEGADLKIRVMETVNADIFGAAKAELYEETSIGTISIQAVPKKTKDALIKASS